MRAALLVVLVGCTPAGLVTPPTHPAHPDAPTGRLAGPPPALRPGVAEPGDATESPASDEGTQPSPSTHEGHEGHH